MPVNLRNWSYVTHPMFANDPYTAPEAVEKVFRGNVYGHPRFEDGTLICTSSLRSIDWSGRRMQTLNTDYVLDGPADADWITYLEQNHPETIDKFHLREPKV